MRYISRVTNFLKEVGIELKKVHWPNRKETLNYTLIVVGFSAGVAIILGGFDLLFTYLVNKFVL